MMMNRCTYQQKQQKGALVGLGINSSSSSMAATNTCPNGVVCPKPRRLVNVNNHPINIGPSRLLPTINPPVEACESWAGTELLDIIFAKGNCGAEKTNNVQVAASPPFFNGSPPVRASNPLIQDEQFGIGKISPLSPLMGSSLASPSSRKTGSAGGSSGRVKCGSKPAPVRIEGFNCHGNRSISAVVA